MKLNYANENHELLEREYSSNAYSIHHGSTTIDQQCPTNVSTSVWRKYRFGRWEVPRNSCHWKMKYNGAISTKI